MPITGGNFLLLHRLFVQIERIKQLNEPTAIIEYAASQHVRDRCRLVTQALPISAEVYTAE